MRRSCLIGLLALAGFVLPTLTADEPTLMGYSAQGSQTQRQWEQKFRKIPMADNIRDYDQRLSARPNNVGSPYDKDNAEWILAKFKEWGLDAHIETFDVLFPTPKERLLELVEPTKFTATLQEATVPQDPTSSQHAEQLPTYNVYSVDGDVTAPLVYVNYGVPDDYEQLARLGVSVKGAIVIARYGKSWRGIKPKVAAEHGAVGCLIYSDPRDDGYYQGDVYPEGAWRPREGVQRGSVADMPTYPGDPLTPGVGATKDAKRLSLNEAKTLTKIPVLPISYGDAQPLLVGLKGAVAPQEWRGALPITYHVGPGPAKVHLRVQFNWEPLKTIYDVIATIPGSVYPDQWIVRGNHHDAWVNGAQDPESGLSPLMEEARALGQLLKQGWKPKRTIIYAAWDGEEPGLLGSTEWGEAHAAELQQKAAVYLNTDSNSRGFLGISGSHSLERFVNDVAKDVTDPETNLPVWKRMQLNQIREAKKPEDRKELRSRRDVRIEALGSGSDYTVFLDHLGIASMNAGFGGEDGGGIYHSIYDDYYWFTHFGDPGFVYGRVLAQTMGTAVMRLADADVLPLEFSDFADTVHKYVGEVEKLLRDRHDEITERNTQIQEGVFTATDDPKNPKVPPKAQLVPPNLDFAALDAGATALKNAADRYQNALNKLQANGGAAIAKASLGELNQRLIACERALTSNEGLPGRTWFKHMIYAPGYYTGYGVKTLPMVREAIEQSQWQQAQEGIARTAQVLQAEATAITAAGAELEKLGGQ